MGSTDATAGDWSRVAGAWDANADEVDADSKPATDRLVERVAPRPGDRLLELGAGPGSLGPVWSELVGPTGTVVISDVAPGMVDVARRRNRGVAGVEVALLDASAIDRPDDSFDVVVCRMGLMFVDRPGVAFGEILRVLAVDGRVGAMTWAAPEHNPWLTCVGMAAAMSGVVDGPPVGPGTIFSLSDPTELAATAKAAGFDDVVVDEADITFRADDVAAHVRRVGSLAGPLAAALDAASPEQRDAVLATAAELAAPYVTPDGVVLPGRALLLSARA
jgi:SAM-dependent methyltransferase